MKGILSGMNFTGKFFSLQEVVQQFCSSSSGYLKMPEGRVYKFYLHGPINDEQLRGNVYTISKRQVPISKTVRAY